MGSKGRNAGPAAVETPPTWLEAGGTTDALHSELSSANAGRLQVVSSAGRGSAGEEEKKRAQDGGEAPQPLLI